MIIRAIECYTNEVRQRSGIPGVAESLPGEPLTGTNDSSIFPLSHSNLMYADHAYLQQERDAFGNHTSNRDAAFGIIPTNQTFGNHTSKSDLVEYDKVHQTAQEMRYQQYRDI